MSLNKNTKRKYTKKILYWEDNIDWNKFTKPNDYGDYYFIRNDGNHLLFENRVFLDKDGNGAIYQAHRYLNQAYYHRTAIVNKNKPIWSNWVLLNTYDDIMVRDNRINDIENRFNWLNGGDGFPRYINHLNWVRNARCDPDMANQINYVWARANDAWNRTEDQYNWCLDDICLNYRDDKRIGNPSGPTSLYLWFTFTQSGSGRDGGRRSTNSAVPIEIHNERISEDSDRCLSGLWLNRLNIDAYNNMILSQDRYRNGHPWHLGNQVNSQIYDGIIFRDTDSGSRRALSYKGRRRGWQTAGRA